MQAEPQTDPAASMFDSLDVGDVIRVPQYENALRVSHDGRDVGLLGVEFMGDSKTGVMKHLVQNDHSGCIYLIAGTQDKGVVKEIEEVENGSDE